MDSHALSPSGLDLMAYIMEAIRTWNANVNFLIADVIKVCTLYNDNSLTRRWDKN